MFLKRLEIIGFKSFAERIDVDFVPGVTAVVGPNGSGKSNIIDAIRWVLGEQSAKSLRGAKMEDIIFAGSDSRKSLNFAEVSLILDNEKKLLPIEYNEVSVTRRVYRSGDSEFLINKQNCRLKDIVDLFLDSGLGREAFSIISQGKVEEILNSKAEERRTIFEEAAGVLKYKTRKKKAESKLLETQDNLNRVQDILFELEGQVEPLKIQASIAKDYLEKKEELEKIEVALTVYEIEEIHGNWETLSKQFEQHKKDEENLSARLQEKEAKIDEARDQIKILDESISDMQNVLLHASEELEKLEGRKEVLKERKKNAFQNKEQLQQLIIDVKKKVDSLIEQKKFEEALTERRTFEANELRFQLKKKEEQFQLLSENLEQKIDSLKSDYIELLNEQAASKNELRNICLQLDQQQVKFTKLEETNIRYVDEREKIVDKKNMIKNKLKSAQEKIEKQIHLFQSEQAEIEKSKARYQKQETALYQAYQYLQQAKSRKDMLEEMEEDYSGFFQGVKEILKARSGKLQGIVGAVAELIRVPKTYETAIEIALGGATQHIVVNTEESGRNAIQYLKKHSYGRATFLPLTVVKRKAISSHQLAEIKQHPSFVGIAADLIQYDAQFIEIIHNLLGSVVIAKDLKGANEMAKQLLYRCRFVTLDGDIVNPGGSMTGGAMKQKSSSLLSRKGELEELKGKLEEMKDKTVLLEDKVKQLKKDIQSKEDEINTLRQTGEELRIQEQSFLGDLKEVEIEERNINERLSIYDMNTAEFKEENEKLKDRQNELEILLKEKESQISTLDMEINRFIEQKNNQELSKESLSLEISELRVQSAAKNEQFIHAQEKLALIKNELEEQESKFSILEEDLELLSNEMSDSTSGEEYLEKAAKQKLHDKQETTAFISNKKNNRVHLQEVLGQLELETKELKRQHKGMLQNLTDEEIKINRLDVELENRLTHLREEYLLSYEGAKEQYPLTIPVDEARKKVKLIKLAIEELGTVNLGAIEEYERVSERFEFLLEQKTDLQEAKDTLFKVIDEMDIEMKRRFEETFKGIQYHFESVFQALFGGGRADLRLTDPDDLLRTGVEIVAQPPGKKLQNLGLLSGGERALTAIALLFSILKVRPVPFCILDEVEAALDEANVVRFSQYLKHYSSETQFIVITHRKGTMEEADVLYGITMQESGVSKVVSVKLGDTNELIAQ
ncbi:chromosome segregation protein SMC [Bacillus sp. 03113]|uniref:chromosome segregation protein SMC n=1 Tax=Bacillus sp. 03113 TaxID=2578211 RepID=UPI00114450F5|nr:chromosome segregation protein SMC [Bacillus sp. 03113]